MALMKTTLRSLLYFAISVSHVLSSQNAGWKLFPRKLSVLSWGVGCNFLPKWIFYFIAFDLQLMIKIHQSRKYMEVFFKWDLRDSWTPGERVWKRQNIKQSVLKNQLYIQGQCLVVIYLPLIQSHLHLFHTFTWPLHQQWHPIRHC